MSPHPVFVELQPVWIVDDDPSIRFVLERALAREGLSTRSFEGADQVLAALQQSDTPPQVVISDIRMSGRSGLELLAQLHRQQPQLAVIVMTAYSDLDSAVAAFQGGAFDYLPKPFDVQQAVELVRRALPSLAHDASPQEQTSAAPEMLGQAAATQDLFRAIGRLSQSVATVLVTGETGTGKELVARALHRHSPVAGGPFIALNTAAIPRELLESELFGHERGAFTGAAGQRRGHFELADGGTLFLDEIGDMPLELQTRLLRVLAQGQFHRVGGHASVRTRVRVIAATHQDLEQLVRAGSFREDLFHRLNVIRLRLPPLRERSQDVPVLAQHFLATAAQQLGVAPKRLSEEAQQWLERFAFPGNVRQLENLCQWLTVMAPSQLITPADLPPEVRGRQAEAMPAAASVGWESLLADEMAHLLQAGEKNIWADLAQRFEAVLIRSALQASQGRRIEAAQRLGMGRNTLARKSRELSFDESENTRLPAPDDGMQL